MSPLLSWLLVVTAGAVVLWAGLRLDSYLWKRTYESRNRDESARYERAREAVARRVAESNVRIGGQGRKH